MRRLLPTGIAGTVAFVVLAIGAAGIAVAYFTTTGSGESAPTAIPQLAKPTIASATPAAGGTVALTWGSVTAPGSGAVTYSVTRDGKSAEGTCATTLVVSCVDSGLEPGTYTYVVTAKWRSWTTSSSSKAATVTVGPADHLVLSATTLTPTAGVADNLTITAKDAKGGTVTTYSGSHSLTFSGASASPGGTVPTVADSAGSDTVFGSPTALTFTAGVASVSSSKNGAMKLYASGKAEIKASDGTISTTTPLEVNAGPATAAKLALAAAIVTPAAGETDNLTITAQDAYGNTATSYTGSHSLTFSGAATIGANKPTVANSSGTATAFGTATALTFTAGVASVSSGKNGAMKLYKAESPSIAASDGTISTATPLEVTVTSVAAAKFVLTATTTTPAAGETDNLTITAQDTYGNTATAYTGSHSLTFSGASASPTGTTPTVSDSAGANTAFGAATTIAFTVGVASASSTKNGAMKLYKSGATNLQVTDGTLLTPSALVVTVAAATAVKFTLSGSVTSFTAGGSSNLTTTALDPYGNTATAYTGSHNLTFSGAATIGANKPTVANSSGTATAFGTATAITFTSGIATVTSSKNGLMKIYASGEADIEVTDGSIATSTPLEVTVAPTTGAKFVLTAASITPAVGETDNLTATVQDTYGNTATAYTGSHSLTFSGASASPSGATPTVSDSAGTDTAYGSATAIEFSAGVATVTGAKNGVTKLYKSGSTSLKVTDGTLLTPTALVVTVAPATAVKFSLSASATSLVAGGSSNLTTTALDAYGNTATAYAGSHNVTFTGASSSPNATPPTVVNSAGTAISFGSATALTFTAGVAAVSSSKNGLMKLYRAESPSIAVSDGTISSATPVAATVTPTSASKWALTNINISAGSLGSTCLFTCTLTGLGNSGTVNAKVAVADTYGNTVSALGSGHAAKITTNGTGTISGTPLAIPSTGAAETATTFTFTSKSSSTETLTAAASEGTAYTAATLTANK